MLAFCFVLLVSACSAETPLPDLSRHSVPLEKVYFDTFGRSAPLPLSRITTNGIKRYRDLIRPLYDPKYEQAANQIWMNDNDLVVGYVAGEDAYAYPIKMLNLHELVNDRIGGEPVLISYCPLCGSGIVFSRRVGGQVLSFGNTSALYQNDMVMFDRQTGSFWYQVGGESIVGELTGSTLSVMPSVTTTWEDWQEQYPKTKLLSGDGEFRVRKGYASDPFEGYSRRVDRLRFPFDIDRSRINSRLRPSEVVIVARTSQPKIAEKVYSPERIGDAAVNDRIANQAVTVFCRRSVITCQAYSPKVDGKLMHFDYLGDDQFRDRETGSTWAASGRSVAGSLTGAKLKPLPSRRAFWFAISVENPDIEIYSSRSLPTASTEIRTPSSGRGQ